MGSEARACTSFGAAASRHELGGAGDDDGGPLQLLWQAEETQEEAEHVRRAAGRPPLQASQRAARSGQAKRVAATRRPPSGFGWP